MTLSKDWLQLQVGSSVTVELVTGSSVSGVLTDFDDDCIVLGRGDDGTLAYLHAIADVSTGGGPASMISRPSRRTPSRTAPRSAAEGARRTRGRTRGGRG